MQIISTVVVAERLLQWQPDREVMYCLHTHFIDEQLRTRRQ